MEASRRSQIALAASASQPEHAHHKEVIKPALDFNFQDVEGLLQIVRVAMEIIDFDQISEDGDKLADGIKFLSLELIILYIL
nr:zinc finger, CW-type [Tanacetum cinerariifolium]